MKIGIATVYDSANYGAFLQAYSTFTMLSELKHDVYVVKIRTEEERKLVYTKKIHGIRDIYPYFSNYKFNIQKFEMMKKDIDTLPYIDLNNSKEMSSLDCIIMGSDEIWNIKVPLFQRQIFYGRNEQNIPGLAFAVCAGQSTTADFSKYQDICSSIRALNYVAARDLNTKRIAEEIKGKEVELVTDPTLIVDPEIFRGEVETDIDFPYLLLYSYYIPKKIKRYLKRFAKENNLKLVSLCTRHSFCDMNINCSPLEFSNIIRDASYVYTSTFHGTIFSLLNHKKVIVNNQQNKVADLLERYGMQSVRIDNSVEYDEFKKKMITTPDYDVFEELHNRIAEASKAILMQFLLSIEEKR